MRLLNYYVVYFNFINGNYILMKSEKILKIRCFGNDKKERIDWKFLGFGGWGVIVSGYGFLFFFW